MQNLNKKAFKYTLRTHQCLKRHFFLFILLVVSFFVDCLMAVVLWAYCFACILYKYQFHFLRLIISYSYNLKIHKNPRISVAAHQR